MRWLAFFAIPFVAANEGLLLDTRLATSELGWTVAPNSGWDEVTGHDGDMNEFRMFQVCNIKVPNQDNWVRSSYIETFGANRVFVEIEFSIRSCEDLRNVKVCKETFNLHYYETDSENDIPNWSNLVYGKVDTIAADRRFKPGDSQTNFETRQIGPLNKKGLYIAIQDTGACMALMHLKVFYKYCPTTTQNLAMFPRTVSGPDQVSLAEAQGQCVKNAQLVKSGSNPRNYCNSDGVWAVDYGACECIPGYTPNKMSTSCTACSKDFFKPNYGNEKCKSCPRRSYSTGIGKANCVCDPGYYREENEDSQSPCSKPPSAPREIFPLVNQTTVTLSWIAPTSFGERDDMYYEIQCFRCNTNAGTQCKECDQSVLVSPGKRLTKSFVTISNLEPSQFYKFRVFAKNGVSSVSRLESKSNEVVVKTNYQPPTGIAQVNLQDITSNSVRMSWESPPRPNGHIIEYETVLSNVDDVENIDEDKKNQTKSRDIRIYNLRSSTTYTFKVRARTSAGFGPYSSSVELKTPPRDGSNGDELGLGRSDLPLDPNEITPTGAQTAQNNRKAQIAGVAAGGAVLVILVIVGLFVCTKRNSYKKGRKFATELGVSDVTFHPVHPISNGTIHHPVGNGQVGNNGAKLYGEPWGVNMNGGGATINGTSTSMLAPSASSPNGFNLDQYEIDPNTIEINNIMQTGDSTELIRGTLIRGSFGNNSKSGGQIQTENVIIKKLKVGFTTQNRIDFLNGAHLLARFNHPNIVQLKGVVINARPMLIIMENQLMPLDEHLRNNRREFSNVQLYGMMRSVCSGMKHLVDEGFVHRDLCARNVFCRPADLTCKITEFGMTRKLSETQFVNPGGKCSYKWSAPEAISQRRYSEASDVWSFGIVAWECMNYGEAPYWEMNDEEVIRKVESGYRLPCTTSCPQQIHQIMLDCWKAMPNERLPFNVVLRNLDRLIRSPNGPTCPPQQQQYRSSYHSSSCLTLDSDTSYASSMGQWLEGIGLGHYRERLQQKGYTTLEHIATMTHRDMNDLGIVSMGDQNHLLESARNLQTAKSQSSYPHRSTLMDMSLERGTTVAV